MASVIRLGRFFFIFSGAYGDAHRPAAPVAPPDPDPGGAGAAEVRA